MKPGYEWNGGGMKLELEKNRNMSANAPLVSSFKLIPHPFL
jgi:hypothetical protein